MAVPDTTTFALSDVINEVAPTLHSLQGCFNDAIGYLFDGNYIGDRDRLSNFRNYGNPFVAIIYADFPYHEGIIYRGLEADFRAGSHVNEFKMEEINNSGSDRIENITLETVGTCDPLAATIFTWGADNIKFPVTVSNNPVNALWSDDGWITYTVDHRVLANWLDNPGSYYFEVVPNAYVTHDEDCSGSVKGRLLFPITLKRYVELDSNSVIKEKGPQTATFHKWNGETVEHVEDAGITVTGFVQSSGGAVDVSIHNNGDVEEVLTCTVRTTATLLREQQVFTVYHRGAPEDYLSCIDITPNSTVANSSNTHYWVVENGSTQMSYSGTLYWQVKVGATEGTAVYVDDGSNSITNLPSLNTVNKGNSWICGDSAGDNAYFYARFNVSDPWGLIETQLIAA